MNGISSTLKDEIKKSQDSKKIKNFKFLAAILVTNLMVATLCLPSKETPTAKKISLKTLHANHQMMVLPLQAMVSIPNEDNSETIVTLISKEKKIIAEKAYLHEEVQGESDLTHFKIEISDADIVKVSQNTDAGVIAVPYVESKIKKSINKKGSRYEVSL